MARNDDPLPRPPLRVIFLDVVVSCERAEIHNTFPDGCRPIRIRKLPFEEGAKEARRRAGETKRGRDRDQISPKI